MARYLVTGVAGFIGSAIARALLKEGASVRGIDNLSTGRMENIEPILNQIDFERADIVNLDDLKSACKGVDYIFHEAAIPSVPKSVKDPIGGNFANVNGTLNLLVAAREAGVRRVVFAASSAAYGNTATLPKREDMPPSPISPYAVAKVAGEMYMQSFYRVYGLETVCLRYFNIFGPRQDPNSQYSGVLALFIRQMLNRETPTVFGDGETSRDFTYIDNAVQANLKACLAPANEVAGRVFNIATGRRFTLNQAFQELKKITGYNGDLIYGPEREGDIKHSLADISMAHKAFGYEPKVGFTEGLELTVKWYREQSLNIPAFQ
jgi:nucleoside-diphosphate-sugar epimerase